MQSMSDLQGGAAIALIAISGGLAAGCQAGEEAGTSGPPFQLVGSIEDVMHDVVYPHAEVVWDSVGTIITEEGTHEIRPGSEAEWLRVTQSAYTIAEAGNLLMLEGRAKDTGDWMEYASGLIDAASLAVEAAQARNAERLFDTGGTIYEACTACHEQYWETPPSAMRP